MTTNSPPTSPSNKDERHHQLLGPKDPGLTPIVICFHGSGPDPLPSWEIVLAILSKTYRVLLYDRGPRNPSPEVEVSALQNYLKTNSLKPRYVLVAHSYGGAFAKLLLHRRPEDIAGLVLVETGQESGLPDNTWKQMIKKPVLGDLPLVVIRGNSLIKQWKDLEASETAVTTDEERDRLAQRRVWLEGADREDERLKKSQLALSRNMKYVHLADCGHDVIRARPELVAEEVKWVIEQLIFARRGQKPVFEVPWWRKWADWLFGSS